MSIFCGANRIYSEINIKSKEEMIYMSIANAILRIKNFKLCVVICVVILLLSIVSCSNKTSESGINIDSEENDDISYEQSKVMTFANLSKDNYWNAVNINVDDNIFYVSDNGIIKKSKNTTECIVSNSAINFMQITDNELIYYSVDSFSKGKGKIYSVSSKGENVRLIFDFSDVICATPLAFGFLDAFRVCNNTIYIKSSDLLFKYDISTKELSYITDISSSAFINNNLYYIDSVEKTFSIYEKDLLTGDIKLILGDGQGKRGTDNADNTSECFDRVFEVNDSLYYTTRYPHRIYKHIPDQKDALIADFGDKYEDLIEGIYISNNKIYCISNKTLFDITLNSDKPISKTEIPDMGNEKYFAVVDDVLYYYNTDEKIKHINLL